MVYKNKVCADKGCLIDFGEGELCSMYGKECEYRGKRNECQYYRRYKIFHVTEKKEFEVNGEGRLEKLSKK
jgi:hypothetical protein